MSFKELTISGIKWRLGPLNGLWSLNRLQHVHMEAMKSFDDF